MLYKLYWVVPRHASDVEESLVMRATPNTPAAVIKDALLVSAKSVQEAEYIANAIYNKMEYYDTRGLYI